MNLNVRDVARLLGTSEKTIYRWIREENIPCYRVHDHYRFNKVEILEWATAKRIPLSPDILKEDAAEGESGVPLSIAAALEKGGIAYRVQGDDKETVLRSVVSCMRLPDEVDLEFLYQVLLAREALGSTGVGEGIAIPHVRNPIVLHVQRPVITLCFLEKPIDFGALDGRPVHCLFAMVSPTVRAHLGLLSRLVFALRDPAFKEALARQGPRDEIMRELRRVEAGLGLPAGETPATDGAPAP